MPYIHQLTFLRFLAACVVLVFHFAPTTVLNVAPIAVTMVSFFFFLSGIVLTINYFDDRELSFKSFFLKRIARIYPVYALALLLTLIFGMSFVNSFPKGNSIILNALLIQSWVPGKAASVNFPAWSVSVEFFFYALFPFLAYFFRNRSFKYMTKIAVVLWIVSFIQHIIMITESSSNPGSSFHEFVMYFPIWHLNTFISGMLCGRYIVLKWNRSKPSFGVYRTFYVIGTILFIGIIFIPNPLRPFISNGFLSPLFFLILAGLALDQSLITRLLGHRILVLLGNASYSIYILQCSFWYLFRYLFGVTDFDPFQFLIYSSVLILSSCLIYLTFEKRLKTILLKKWRVSN